VDLATHLSCGLSAVKPASTTNIIMSTTAPYTPTPAPRKSRLRRILVILLLIIGIPLLLLVGAAVFFDNQITQQVVREVNKNLKNDLLIGDASLSFLSGFPNASVDLSNVRLKDAMGGYLLAAEQISFRFDLFSLFGEQIKIRTVQVSNGAVRLVVNLKGQSNTDIFKETTKKEPTTESDLQLALESAELKHVTVLYDNKKTRQIIDLMVNQAGLGGNFSARQFRLSSQADLQIARVESDGSRYLAGEPITYDAVLAVDLQKGVYDLQRVEVQLGKNTFSMDGIAVVKPDFTDLNLKLVSQEGDISMLANLLPGEYHAYFNDFQSTGNYTCTGLVKGRVSKTETPLVSFEVALRDGKVSSEKLQSPLRNVSFKARYNAQPDGSGDFEVADFKGNFGGEPLALSLKITNLNDPLVDFHCTGALPLAAAYGLLDNEAITDGDGIVRLHALTVQGRYADMTSMRTIANVNASGDVQFERAALTYNKVPLVIETGSLRWQDNLFRADSFQLRAGKSDFALDGSAKNLLPVLFADSLNTTDAFLDFTAKMRTQNLDVDELLAMFTVQETAAQAGSQQALDSLHIEKNAERKQNTDKLRGTFEAVINHFKYGKIEGQRFGGKLTFDHNELIIHGLTQAMNGNLQLDGNAYFEQKPSLKMYITAQNLDLQTMMAQCENFGQEVITDQNLHGRLNGRMVLWAYWDDKGEFDMKRLHAFAEIHGNDGEMVNLKLLEDFSTFVHLEDLRRVKFTNMQNYLEISNQKLYLPAMLIQSNALNLTLSGTHTFDNDIDYKMKINAGQVLMNRMRKHDNDLDPLPAEKGLFNLYYTIVGNLDKYAMKRGKKAVQNEFEQSMGRRRIISAALDAEFRQLVTSANTTASVPPVSVPAGTQEEYLNEIQGGGGGQ